jgi:hypothetical protein
VLPHGTFDWKLAHELGKDEARWPYDPSMVAEARQSYDAVYAALDDIREVNDTGIRALMTAIAGAAPRSTTRAGMPGTWTASITRSFTRSST